MSAPRRYVKSNTPKSQVRGRERLAIQHARLRGAKYAQARSGPSYMPASLYATGRSSGSTELKCLDGFSGTIMLKNTGSVAVVELPNVGSAFYQRIGNRVRAKSLHLFGYIQPSYGNAASLPGQVARVMVLYDRQFNGAAPAAADILLAYNSNNATSTSVYDGLNMNNRDRFTVLRDRRLYLPPIGIAGVANGGVVPEVVVEANNGNEGLLYNEYIKLKGMETHFKNSTTPMAAGDVATGGYVILCISEDPNATSAYRLSLSSRFKFFD